jgi:hypothetical protein
MSGAAVKSFLRRCEEIFSFADREERMRARFHLCAKNTTLGFLGASVRPSYRGSIPHFWTSGQTQWRQIFIQMARIMEIAARRVNAFYITCLWN